jgi:hypothetical protein
VVTLSTDSLPLDPDEDGNYLHRIEGWSYDEPPLEGELPPDEARVPEGDSPAMDDPAPMDHPAPLGDFAPEEEPGEFRPLKRLRIDEGAAARLLHTQPSVNLSVASTWKYTSENSQASTRSDGAT